MCFMSKSLSSVENDVIIKNVCLCVSLSVICAEGCYGTSLAPLYTSIAQTSRLMSSARPITTQLSHQSGM